MSTDLYRLRVLALDPDRRSVNLRVFLVYYDWSGVPTDPSFFLRVLWDEADTRFGHGGPLGDEISVDQLCSEEWIDANTRRFIERVTRLTLHNDPLPEGETPPTFIYSNYTDEDRLTQGDYEVIVTDAKWISHLKVGQTWQTTAYATRADMPPDRATVLIDAPMQGVAKKAAKKTSTKKAAKKTPAKKAAKKTSAKKTTAKKTAKKTSTKKTAKNTSTKKTAKNTPAKKAAKKTTAKKTAKKTSAKKAAKKTPTKKAAKKTSANKATAKTTPANKTAKKTPARKAARATLRPSDL